jgi:hypothetical protein
MAGRNFFVVSRLLGRLRDFNWISSELGLRDGGDDGGDEGGT